MFVGDLKPVTNSAVATIGGTDNIPEGIGTVEWTWRDDDGKVHTYRLDDVYYFPDSPVNLLSVTEFAKTFGIDPLEQTRIRFIRESGTAAADP